MSKVVIVDGDSWKGLYIDGELVLEDHRLSLVKVIEAVTGECPECVEADFDWIAERGAFPRKLSDVEVV